MLRAIANLFRTRTPSPHNAPREYLYTVVLGEEIPGRTKRRGNRHYLIVHASNDMFAEAEAKAIAQRYGITLHDGDILDVQSSGRLV